MRKVSDSVLPGLLACLLPTGASATEADLWSPGRFAGSIDVRVVAADAELSWLNGGFGKTRFGEGDSSAQAVLAEAVMVWTPRLSDAVTGTVSLEIQDGQDTFVDVSEAYLTWRGGSVVGARVSGRAGLYFPLISLEHDGPDWAVADTLTPSAINTWVAEELRVVGAEATARFPLGPGEGAVTAGLFGYDDKAGTLLGLRGWALHDLKSTLSSAWPLSPVGDRGQRRGEPLTTTTLELDDRVGAYARVEWKPASALMLSVFGYDNAGDRDSRVRTERAWDTRFLAVGTAWTLNDRTRLRAQAMSGATDVGLGAPGTFRVSVDYRAAYVSLSRDIGPGALTGRVDRFVVEDRLLASGDNNDETGWASTVAYRWDFARGTSLTTEALVIDSDRPSRARLGVAPDQTDVQFQTALRRQF